MDDAGRYQRQERLPQVGREGQEALRRAHVAVIGLGALGGLGADLLARAGVGSLLLVDRDVVEWTNLQRQVLYTEADAATVRLKAEAAAERLAAVNREVELRPAALDLDAGNAAALLADCDLVLDGTDNFAVRYLLNDWAVREGRAYVYAGVVATYGLTGAVMPGGACLRCTWPEPPPPGETPTCRSAGVLGPAVAVVAGLAVTEALKILLGRRQEVHPGYSYVDAWSGELRQLRATRDPECPCCSRRDFPWLEGRRGAPRAEVLCGGGAVRLPPPEAPLDLEAAARRLEGTVDALQRSPACLRFRSSGLDVLLFADGRALVRGTEDPARARSLLARTVGQ